LECMYIGSVAICYKINWVQKKNYIKFGVLMFHFEVQHVYTNPYVCRS